MKTSKEIVNELIELVAQAVGGAAGGNAIMLNPIVNMIKIKTAHLSESDTDDIIDKVHQLSRHIEKESGKLSPYHGVVENVNVWNANAVAKVND